MSASEVEGLLDLARESLARSRWDLEGRFYRGAVSGAYYAMFHAAQALLLSEGLAYSRHSAVVAAFGREFARPQRLNRKLHDYLLKAFDARQAADYHSLVRLSAEDAAEQIRRAEEFLAAVENHLGLT